MMTQVDFKNIFQVVKLSASAGETVFLHPCVHVNVCPTAPVCSCLYACAFEQLLTRMCYLTQPTQHAVSLAVCFHEGESWAEKFCACLHNTINSGLLGCQHGRSSFVCLWEMKEQWWGSSNWSNSVVDMRVNADGAATCMMLSLHEFVWCIIL